MSNSDARRARLEPLLVSARKIADPHSELGQTARRRLQASSGLSAAGVELALTRCLETAPSEAEIESLIRSTPSAQVAHVLLSANVFVAAHRAIAIALAASERVQVRASRREPDMAELLSSGAPNSFQLVSELTPHAGDRVWAYGRDSTLQDIAVTLPPGVAFHGHGSGFGVGVIHGPLSEQALAELVPRLAEDIVLFDQRGCLSPRVLLVEAGPELARDVARAIALELEHAERAVPRGHMTDQELAEVTTYCASASFSGAVFAAGLGFVSTSERWLLPPVGRNLHVQATDDATQAWSALRPMITSCAFAGSAARRHALEGSLRGARLCDFGRMQSPPFDGPVDLRDL